jgi:dTDP-glucose 4,6-dehydratase
MFDNSFLINEPDLEYICTNGEPIFKSLKNKKILIVGATSFIGMWLTESLLYADYKLNLCISILIISRNDDKINKRFSNHIKKGKIKIIFNSIENVSPDQVKNIDFAINLATYTDSNANDLQLTENIKMFDSFWNLIKHSKVESVLFTSSGAAYGINDTNLCFKKESDFCNFSNPYTNNGYGLGKLCSEFLGFQRGINDKINFKVARLFSFTGAFLPLNGQYIIGNFISNILNSQPIDIKNSGNVYRSYLYGADMALWLLTILILGKNEIYNVGSDIPISTLDLANLVINQTNSKSEIIFSKVINKNESYVPNIDKIKENLNVNIAFNLEESILRMYNWNKKMLNEKKSI